MQVISTWELTLLLLSSVVSVWVIQRYTCLSQKNTNFSINSLLLFAFCGRVVPREWNKLSVCLFGKCVDSFKFFFEHTFHSAFILGKLSKDAKQFHSSKSASIVLFVFIKINDLICDRKRSKWYMYTKAPDSMKFHWF